MNLFPKFLERNNVFAKLREGSDESIINVCNSIISFISNGSLRGSQPAISVDEILMIFLEYITISTSYYGIKSVLLCTECIAKINKKYEDCVLQTGLVGAIVDLLRTMNHSKFKHKNNENLSTEIGLMIARILTRFTSSDKRSCLIFRLHHGIHCLIQFVESNKNSLLKTNQYTEIIEHVLNICYQCVSHSEHAAMQMFESNGLEMCLQFLSNHNASSKLAMKQCTNLIYSICRLNPTIHATFIKTNGFKIIVDYLCKQQTPNTEESKSNIIKLLQLISGLCTDNISAKTMLSNNTLSTLYPFLLSISQNEEIKCFASQLLNNILRYGMKDIIQSQSSALYKFRETYTKIHLKKNVSTLTEEMEPIEFPELEPSRLRKATRQEMINDLECYPKSIIPFMIQAPSYPWSKVLPSDLNKIRENIESKNKKRKKRHSLPSNKYSKGLSKGLSKTRSSSSLLIKHVIKDRISSDNNNKYVSTKWIRNYYTHTTSSYLDTTSLRGDPLCFQSSNLIIKLLYEQIKRLTTFTPKIVYDRNENVNHICDDKTLKFESRFECGNIHRVIQTGAVEYDLLVSSDYNSTRHRQWFYFRIKNMIQNVQYKFNIVNFDKNDSVFNRGCKPTLYSTKRFKETGIGWSRATANDIYYYSNAFRNNYQPKFKQVFASTFISENESKSSDIEDENIKESKSEHLSPKSHKINIPSSAKSAPSSSSSLSSIIPMKRLRNKRARYRNKKLELTMDCNIDSNYTNVLRRDDGISFDIILSDNNKRLIGGRKKRKIPNINVPSIPSILMSKKEEADSDKKYHYTLTFTIRFPYSNDTCFLSYFYPFSYSDLQGMLNVLTISPITNSLNMFRRQLLCRSRWGNRIDLLTITNFNSTQSIIRDRAVIILSSRVHPGEVNASWIMKGIIDFLVSKNSVASELRNRFVFKIIPCLNPDGVICGNHRCSLSGVDLNRQYLNPSHIYHPSIFHLKKLVSTIYSDMQRKIFLICDIHGHSRMMNVTLYGCSTDSDYKKVHKKSKIKMDENQNKLFAYLLSERAPNMFNYDQCIWNLSKQKEGTARVVFWRQFNIQNAFTLESTFCGSNLNYNFKGFHFNTQHYLEIGAKFCGALYDIASQSNQSKLKIQNAIKYLKTKQNQNNNNNGNTKKLRMRKRKHSKM